MSPDSDAITDARNPKRWRILAVLCISVFLAVVDNTIVNVALPTLSRDLNASISDLQWVVDAYALVFAGLLLVGGSLGDRFGRKGALQIGLVGFATCSVVAGLAGSSGHLIVARGAMGIFAALVFPATLAILSNVFTDESERAKAIGVWSGVVGLAVALGPITGGFLLQHFSWGSIFFVNVPVAAVALLLGARLLPTSRDHDAPRLDLIGFALSIIGIVGLVFTIIEAPNHGWLSGFTVGGIAASLAVLAGFAIWEARAAHPMLEVRVFANLPFSAASVSIAAAFFTLFGFIFLVTQYFQFVRGYDTLSAGVHTLPFAFATGITAPIAAALALRVGVRRIIGSGLAVMAVGFFVASRYTPTSSYWGVVIVGMVLIAIGLGLVSAPATTAIISVLPREKAGVGSAINDVTREIGGTLGVAVVGSVFASVYGPSIGRALQGAPIPAEAVAAARSSVGAALQIAQDAPGGSGAPLVTAARNAFMDGFSTGSLVAAAVALGAAVLAFAFLPSRPPTTAAEETERADTEGDALPRREVTQPKSFDHGPRVPRTRRANRQGLTADAYASEETQW
jgi:EmrB/QacA subfamily drug resistance transporter